MSSSKKQPELKVLAYVKELDAAREIQEALWNNNKIVSAIDETKVGNISIYQLLVNFKDFEESENSIGKIDPDKERYIAPEDFSEYKKLLTEKILFNIDKPAVGKQEEPEEADPKLIAEKAVKSIRRLFGEKEAQKMTESFQHQGENENVAPEVSIVILMHNKWLHTQRCLWSLFDTKDVKFELILVDNGSSEKELKEGISAYLNECLIRDISVKLLTFTENVGAVRGRNEAIPHCSGNYIVFLDNDVVVRRRSWLDQMTSYLKENPDTGAVGAKMVYPNYPHLIQCAGCDVSPSGRVDFRGRGEKLEAKDFNEIREVQCLISACIMFPKHVVQEVGLLDMAYHPVQFEDIDYCYRIREKGYKTVYLPGVEMYHFENVTTGGTQKLNYTYLTIKNGKKFKDKWAHMYSKENGPEESSMKWKDIISVCISEIGRLEVLN